MTRALARVLGPDRRTEASIHVAAQFPQNRHTSSLAA